jgi:epoxyqueuosine reductase QueG
VHPLAQIALELGFVQVCAVPAHPFTLWAQRLEQTGLASYVHLSSTPQAPFPVRSIFVALLPAPPLAPWPEGSGRVSGFYFISNKGYQLQQRWQREAARRGYAVSAGGAPLRAAALRAGMGVCGLNGLLITPRWGSYVYLAGLMSDVEVPALDAAADVPRPCLGCGACARACPAGAIDGQGIHPTRCLRFLMSQPQRLGPDRYAAMGDRILGCETCQQVCPLNRDQRPAPPDPAQSAPFSLERLLTAPDLDAVAALIGRNYARKGRLQLQAALAAANTGRADLAGPVGALRDQPYEPLAQAARWAAERLTQRAQEEEIP